MTSNQQILSDLQLMHEANQEVELLSTYKGVPFICKAQILEISAEKVRLKANDPALVCLHDGNQARVLGSEYFEPASAQVLHLNLHEGLLDLGDFSYVGTKLGERMIVRVEPHSSAPVTLHGESQRTAGELADISLNGMGVRLAQSDYHALLRPGTIMKISVSLPAGDIQVNGTVMSVTRLPEAYRLAIRFNKLGAEKTTIFRYLIQRRAEIEEELQQAYAAALAK